MILGRPIAFCKGEMEGIISMLRAIRRQAEQISQGRKYCQRNRHTALIDFTGILFDSGAMAAYHGHRKVPV